MNGSVRADADHAHLLTLFLHTLVFHVLGLEQQLVGSIVGASDTTAGGQDHGKSKGCDKGDVLEMFHGLTSNYWGFLINLS